MPAIGVPAVPGVEAPRGVPVVKEVGAAVGAGVAGRAVAVGAGVGAVVGRAVAAGGGAVGVGVFWQLMDRVIPAMPISNNVKYKAILLPQTGLSDNLRFLIV